MEEDESIERLEAGWRIPRPSIHGSMSSSRSSVTTVSLPPPITSLLTPPLTHYHHNLLAHDPHSTHRAWSTHHSSSSGSTTSSVTEGSQSQLIAASRLEKDLDTVSIASSMHFTIVNGMGGSREKTSSGCCRGSYQLPILVVTMTFLIFLGILGAVLFIQIRARSLRYT